MNNLALAPSSEEDLLTPSAEAWQALSSAERQAFLDRVASSLEQQADLMAESRPHSRAKSKALDTLGRHFQRMGRHIYLASELPVLYPGKSPIKPDLMAVLDVQDPGDADERRAWVVADEGKGLDLVLEVYYAGDEKKDLVDNVMTYADLGIPEYFIYDRRRQALHGYALPSPSARRYQKMRSRFGRLHSRVLGLDLLLFEGRLRFYLGDAELPDSDALLLRLEEMVDDIQRRRDEAEARAEAMLTELRATVLEILSARGLPPTDEVRARVLSVEDSAALRRLAIRAATVPDLGALFA